MKLTSSINSKDSNRYFSFNFWSWVLYLERS